MSPVSLGYGEPACSDACVQWIRSSLLQACAAVMALWLVSSIVEAGRTNCPAALCFSASVCGVGSHADVAGMVAQGADGNLDVGEPEGNKKAPWYTAPIRWCGSAPEAVHHVAWRGKGA